jgi:prephenate dehydratase
MGLALRSKKFKETLSDPQQENDMLARAERLNLDLIKSTFTRRLLKTIIEETKRLQDEDRSLAAFQGEHGAYGEVAARQLVPDGAYIPCLEFIDVFRGVENGYFDLGVVPVENSLEGAVTQVNDLLTTTDLKVIGEVKVTVSHCLLATEATDYREIRQVFSHPQALAQCRNFLMRNKLESRPFYDTAGAAKMLARENPRASAAIASSLCAELYDLEIINVPHKAGRLYAVLKLFADAEINLTRIASMPLRSDPGNYSFFLDFEGSDKNEKVATVLKKMEGLTKWMKYLGSYPADKATS